MTDTRLIHRVGVGALGGCGPTATAFRLEPDVDPEIGFLERFKPIGELALICKVLFREGVAGSRQAQLARQLLDHTWRETLDGGRMAGARAAHRAVLTGPPSRCTCPSRSWATASPRWSGPRSSTTGWTAGRGSR
ncbi:hypothetical protein LV779_26345 [Streptomyces thinghirensis]|nr:hypothetical protein [Streptomyces thinghirensis]